MTFPYSGESSAGFTEFELRKRFPTREIAYERYAGGVWRPFAEYPRTVGLAMQTEVFVCVGEVVECAGGRREFFQFPYGVLMASFYGSCVGGEPGVVFEYVEQFHGR